MRPAALRRLAVLPLAAACLLAWAVPASAGGAYKPDALIKTKGSGGFSGNNIYNTDGTDQSRSLAVIPGGDVTFVIKAQNDGTMKDRLLVNASIISVDGEWQTTFKKGDTKITNKVLGGSYKTARLAPGESRKISLRLKNFSGDGHLEYQIEVDSVKDGVAVIDAVRAGAGVP